MNKFIGLVSQKGVHVHTLRRRLFEARGTLSRSSKRLLFNALSVWPPLSERSAEQVVSVEAGSASTQSSRICTASTASQLFAVSYSNRGSLPIIARICRNNLLMRL